MKTIPQHHNLPKTAILKDILNSDIVTVYFYDDIAIVEAKEGVTLSYKTAFSVLLKGLNYIKASPWVYISNRLNSYALKPQDYKYLEKIPSLKGLSIVYESEIGKRNAILEAKFFNKPHAAFSDLTEAYNWGKELLNS